MFNFSYHCIPKLRIRKCKKCAEFLIENKSFMIKLWISFRYRGEKNYISDIEIYRYKGYLKKTIGSYFSSLLSELHKNLRSGVRRKSMNRLFFLNTLYINFSMVFATYFSQKLIFLTNFFTTDLHFSRRVF